MPQQTMKAIWSNQQYPVAPERCADCGNSTGGDHYRALDLEVIDRLITGGRVPSLYRCYRCRLCHEERQREQLREEEQAQRTGACVRHY
jgi:hypothetical protein